MVIFSGVIPREALYPKSLALCSFTKLYPQILNILLTDE